MQHPVEVPVDPDVLGDVVFDECEAAPRLDRAQIIAASGDEVVHADDVPISIEKEFAQMRTDEPRSASDQHPHCVRYVRRTGLRPIE